MSSITLERQETPIAYCSVLGESLRFDEYFRPCFSPFATIEFYKVKFTDISNAGKTARKMKIILQSNGF